MENISAVRQVRRTTRPPARCRRSSAQPAKERTAGTGRNGFLTHQFVPFYVCDGNRNASEREFFNSLSQLCHHYKLALPDVSGYDFPQNIYQSWQAVAPQVKESGDKMDCLIMADEDHRATLATVKVMDTGTTLYYIPVRPLWAWSKCAGQLQVAELVTSIYAYLYQVVKIPFYTEQYTFMDMQYETLENWLQEETCDEDDTGQKEWQEHQIDELYMLKNSGLHIYRSIIQPEHLIAFAERATAFAATDFDPKLVEAASGLYHLYKDYPTRSVFDNICPDLYHPEEHECVRAEHYISFYWSGNDCFYDTLIDMIDTSFQEYGLIDEPLAVQVFDGKTAIKNEDFDFETRLFDLLNKLCAALNPYDHEECEPTV